MSDHDKIFAGSVPENYDTFMVPMIFGDFAIDLANRAVRTNPKRLLETAAGSGVVTRALAPRLGADARYSVTDLNPPMLARAQAMQPADDRLDWQVANALDLPFDDGTFDVLLCQFGVMFFPDRVAGYSEARRVLKPGGEFLFNVWDRIETNDFANVVTQSLARVFPGDPPMFLKRTPHGYYDVDLIRTELEQAGFSDISIETRTEISPAASARIPAQAYCQGTPLQDEIITRDPDALITATNTAELAIRQRWGEGPIRAQIQGHVITARP